jgi:LL-diaminopimelate aminotransferase
MVKINGYFQKLSSTPVFPIIDQKLAYLKEKGLAATILNLGVGDIAAPLAPTIIEAICKATYEMGKAETLHGYGPPEGYLFLREAIASNEYFNLNISADEIFISDGINTDIVNILDLFSLQNTIAIPDPCYPVYLEACLIAGRGKKVSLLPCTEESGFLPDLPKKSCDIVFLCSPHNPTGVAFTKDALSEWVSWAKQQGTILLYDSAYAAFINSKNIPRSIYEIEGAKEVAIEFCSFSKSAGFTGLRCAYAVVPHALSGLQGKKRRSLNALWLRRQNSKFNGVAYPIQRGAEAALHSKGKAEIHQQILTYLMHAKQLREGLLAAGYSICGGIDSPYIWWKTPAKLSSWEFFNHLLDRCQLLTIPGSGFGIYGEGYLRLSAFTSESIIKKALNHIKNL